MFYFLSLLHLDKSRGLRTQQHHPAGFNCNQLKKLSMREIRSLTQDVLKQAEVTSRAALIKINIKLQQEHAYKQSWPCACNINRQKNKRRILGIDGQREGGRRRKETRKTKRLLDILTNASERCFIIEIHVVLIFVSSSPSRRGPALTAQ